jgi:hypothetical protein
MIRAPRISWTLVLAGWMAAAVQGWTQTVSIELKNGDRVSGLLVSETNNRVLLSNAWSRELSIPLAEIARRTVLATTNAPAPLLAAVPATNLPPVAATATNKPVSTNLVALAKAVAATNRLLDHPFFKAWHGEIHAGVDLTFSERDRQVYNARMKLTYARGPLKNVIDYDMTYGRSQYEEQYVSDTGDLEERDVSITDANRMNGFIKTEYDITKRWYGYNLGGAGYDKIRKIDLRYELGPGLGYRLIQWSNFFVNVEAGATYQNERREGEDINTIFGRLAENASWRITPRLSWDERLEYLPALDDPSIYRVRFETNLRYAMLQNIFFNLSLINIYDADPAREVSKNDLQIRSSIGVKF